MAPLIRRYDEAGKLTDELAAPDTAGDIAGANEADLLSKARAAYAGNLTYLAIASPTNAQTAAQVKALTRQVNALIRLVGRDLASTEGT